MFLGPWWGREHHGGRALVEEGCPPYKSHTFQPPASSNQALAWTVSLLIKLEPPWFIHQSKPCQLTTKPLAMWKSTLVHHCCLSPWYVLDFTLMVCILQIWKCTVCTSSLCHRAVALKVSLPFPNSPFFPTPTCGTGSGTQILCYFEGHPQLYRALKHVLFLHIKYTSLYVYVIYIPLHVAFLYKACSLVCFIKHTAFLVLTELNLGY